MDTRQRRSAAVLAAVATVAAAALTWVGPAAAATVPGAAAATVAGAVPNAVPGAAVGDDGSGDSFATPQERLAQADALAAAEAARSGQPVEVLARATPTDTVIANPDGSFRMEQTAGPSRVRRADGKWLPLDLNLRLAGDRVRPTTPVVDVSFSAGGTAPLAVLHTAAGRFALTWPGRLPTPLLTGDTATYAEVRPGVDLVVRATDDGFTHVLAVRTRPAAISLATERIRFGLAGSTLTPRQSAGGGVDLVAADGSVAMSAGEALIWDSRAGADARSPGNSDRTAVAAVSTDGTDMVLAPDQAYLAAPETTYPVFIDPAYGKGYKRWAFANNRNESNNSEVRVGRRPDTGAIYRSFFTYDVALLRGKHILGAKLLTTIRHSWSCASTPINLYRVGGHGSGRLTWDGPNLLEHLASASGHAHKPSGGTGCSDDPQDDSHLEFGGNTTREIREAAAANWTEFPFGFSARSSNGDHESAQDRWKKLRAADTRLVVDYNSLPTTPTYPSGEGRGCATGPTRPVFSTGTPTLRAIVGDPDPETDLTAQYQWERWDNTVSPAVWRAVGSGSQTRLRRGDTAAFRIGSGLVHGGVYRWRVQTTDPWRYGSSSGTDASNFTGWCEFEVDTVNPSAPPAVASAVYGSDVNQVYGGVGRTAAFTLSPAGVTDVVAYRYGWSDPPTTQVSVALGAGATVRLTPPPPKPDDPTSGGQTHLYVVSVDRSGRISPVTDYPFNVGSATAPTHQWKLNDPHGALVFADSAGGAAAQAVSAPTATAAGLTVNGPAAAAASSVRFDGVDDRAVVAAPVLNTADSFTLSVWARANAETGDWRNVVSAPGVTSSALMLGRSATGKWRVGMPQTDTMNPAHTNQLSTSPVRVGAWTHLTVVYDAGTQRVHLYVNGVREVDAAQPPVFAARELQIGSVRYNGVQNYLKPWQGEIADVRTWDRVLSAGEIAPQATVLAGRWTLDGDGTETSPFRRLATPQGTVGWTDDRYGMPLSAFEGDAQTAALRTAEPALRTNESFTVAAWVRLDGGNGRFSQVLGQAGTVREAFYLRYDHQTDRWCFMLSSADVAAPTYYPVRSQAAPELGEWTHLVGVYDAVNGTAKLYQDGTLQQSLTGVRGWASSGVFEIGRESFGTGSFFDGGIDEVRAYAGAMPAAEVARLAAT